MALHISSMPRIAFQGRASAVLGMIIIGMLWSGVGVEYWRDRQNDLREVERRNQNYAMLFEENVLRSIGEIDKALLYLRRTVEATKDSVDYQTIALTTDVLSEIIVQVAIIDANGLARGTNAVRTLTKIIDVSDREHFRIHLGAAEDKLFISKPLIGRASNKWSVQLTRRFSNKDGSFAGVVVASMDPAHFAAFYDKIDLGESTAVAMVGSDGVIRSSGGSSALGLQLGQDISPTRLFKLIRTGPPKAFQDSTSAKDALLVTARQVRSYPLWVTVNTRASDIYNGSWGSLKQNSLVAAWMTILILIALKHILRAESDAHQKAHQLALTLEHMSQGIMLVTKDRQIPIINERCGELLRLSKETIDSRPSLEQLNREVVDRGWVVASLVAAESGWPPALVPRDASISEYQRTDGAVIEVRNAQLPDGGFVTTFTDITSQREAEKHIARLAAEDPLTRLPNRRVFRARIESAISPQQTLVPESSARNSFAVLFLDVDRFKTVNDTLGHRIGDKLLAQMAVRLRSIAPTGDFLARLGGDEFAILVSSANLRAAAERLAQQIITELSEPFQVDNHLITASVSIGIAICPDDGRTEDEVLAAADLALYAVKATGRGAYRFFEKAMNDEASNRRQVEVELRDALAQGQLELHYQPIIDLRRDAIIGFEALARWRHPVRGAVPPSTFISIAEDSGLILPLGEWALMEACRAAKQLPDNLKIAVNLSPVQFSNSDLPRMISAILTETGLRPGRLELEITERIFLDNNERTLAMLHSLRQLGVTIALDDFGTGYSSLSYLRSFPFDTLKIDRGFVSDLGVDTNNNVIVQAVILIASGLGIKTVAEGIEADVQQQLLKALGCDFAQGYLFGRPTPAVEATRLLADRMCKMSAA